MNVSKGKYSGNHSGRSDYGKSGKGGIESDVTSGDKGIPPGIKKVSDQSVKRGGILSTTDGGDKGIPPMGENPTAKPALD